MSSNNFDPATLEAMRCRLPEYLTARGVELRRQGNRLVGKCPHHDDTSPSFAVFPNGKNCGCYPCGFTGDVFSVSQWLGRSDSFTSAVADVASVLGVYLPSGTAQGQPRAPQEPPRPERKPEVPFSLSPGDRERIRFARWEFSNILHGGGPLLGEIAESLSLPAEALRHAAFGECGLGFAEGWLCYAYPNGLKLRNRNPERKPRFRWIVGKATAPWRMEWALRPEVRTIYLAEGESDCMALIAAGLESDGTAACVASPGKDFSQSWAPMFAGRKVVLCFDSDPPGMTAAVRVAGLLAGHSASVSNWKGARP
ncbi:MAG: CHC2 zinc finger domain-containing protein [Verrucomicrobia bacterium]|nr:CHC2 zinc finger domain-containing protein [Verrucomicrobiota bacterium]